VSTADCGETGGGGGGVGRQQHGQRAVDVADRVVRRALAGRHDRIEPGRRGRVGGGREGQRPASAPPPFRRPRSRHRTRSAAGSAARCLRFLSWRTRPMDGGDWTTCSWRRRRGPIPPPTLRLRVAAVEAWVSPALSPRPGRDEPGVRRGASVDLVRWPRGTAWRGRSVRRGDGGQRSCAAVAVVDV
jgi:hypothetical protein